MSIRITTAAIVLGVVGVVVACSVNVDVTSKACPCGDGFVCDTARNLCVLPGDLGAQTVIPVCDPCPCTVDGDCKDPSRAHCSPNKVCVECSPSPDSCSVGYCNDQFQCTAGCKNEGDCAAISPGTHCDLGRHQCVDCVATTFPCADATKECSPSGTCVESCASAACTSGKTCCSGFCLDTTKDPLDCGGCGTVCSKTNGTPTCVGSACTWACASGFAHCGTTNSGCETNTRSDAAHCGSCTKVCTATGNHVTAACTTGTCSTACAPGYADADDDMSNGCEATCGGKNERCCPTGPPCANGGCNPAGKCPQ